VKKGENVEITLPEQRLELGFQGTLLASRSDQLSQVFLVNDLMSSAQW
jgi:hypothetical protein